MSFIIKFFFIFFVLLNSIACFSDEAPEDIVGAITVGLVEARSLYNQGAVFIDVRSEQGWRMGHIRGAVHLDFNDEAFVLLYASDALNKETPLVFYCDSPLIPSSAMASFFAVSWGYKKVYYFRDGYYAWMASDHPIDYTLASVE